VFAAAGSVVLRPSVVQGALTVWLRASAVQEQQNIAHSGQDHRPLPEDPIAVLQQMSAARLPAYERLADITVDVASDPKVTCDRVMQALQARAK
jgi:shikimate kinase